MNKLTCLIIDDEELARQMLEAYAKKIEELEIIALCSSTKEAKYYLRTQSIDLLLLDIQMPQQTGIELLEELQSYQPLVIFTTAYSNFALKSYELNVVDYLLKPISFVRFQEAVQKAILLKQTQYKAAQFDAQTSIEDPYIVVHSEHKHHKIKLKNILYIESLKEYVRYHTTEGRIIEHNTMKKLEATLPKTDFLRIHRSYIVANRAIKSYENNTLILQESYTLPVGKTYKKNILQQLFG
jgi:DNA-binding LytR/AlgR family response regulator